MSFKRMRFMLIIIGLLLASLLTSATLDAGNKPQVRISSIGLSKRVVEFPLTPDSWAIQPWEKNVGHLQGTGWFDQPGNIVLAGHSTLPNGKPGTFYRLDKVAVGTDITLFDGSATRHYTVTSVQIVSEYDLSVVNPTSDDRLTLITCEIGSYNPVTKDYDNRLVVTAERVS